MGKSKALEAVEVLCPEHHGGGRGMVWCGVVWGGVVVGRQAGAGGALVGRRGRQCGASDGESLGLQPVL